MAWIKLSFLHILIFVVFYYYFVSPIRIEIINALYTEKQLTQELLKQQKYYVRNRKNPEKIYFNYHTQEALSKYFINKMIASKFLIEEIYATQIRKYKNLIIISFKITLFGNIFQLKNLIDHLGEDKILINIDEVIVKKSSNKIVMKIDVFNINDVESKQFYVLQWIGYTEKNKIIKGLLRLEDGNVLEVSVGSLINNSLRILEIKKDQMLVQVGNRKSMIQYGQFLEI